MLPCSKFYTVKPGPYKFHSNRHGAVQKMNRETEKGALKMKKDEIGGSADLHSAARSGDLAAVQLIISSNPLAVNSRDKHSRTPYPFSSRKITQSSIL